MVYPSRNLLFGEKLKKFRRTFSLRMMVAVSKNEGHIRRQRYAVTPLLNYCSKHDSRRHPNNIQALWPYIC